jgi:DeoR/GlpR family transcriptional regulator of sugar metabolism
MENSQLLSKKNYKSYQKERIDAILKILQQQGYVTVKHLTELLSYSNATINRDLNVMEQQKLVKRSYGGVELAKYHGVALPFRYEKMKAAKMKIAKKAAEYVKDGDTIFIDGTTTTEYMGQYLLDKKDIHVITNNMALVIFLSQNSIPVTCLGGTVIERPYMLGGPQAAAHTRRYHADKMFFSTAGISLDGTIQYGGACEIMLETMMENADEIFCLSDHDKLGVSYSYKKDFDEIDYIVTDFEIPQEIQEKHSETKFILA